MHAGASAGDADDPGAAAALEFRDVAAGYRGRYVLREFSLMVRKGESVAVMGPNGAGKSTLFRVGVGLLKPREGRVLLSGQDVTTLSSPERARAGVAFMMQGGRIFPSLTVKENLLLSASRGKATDTAQAIERVVAALPVLKQLWPRPSALLSGGERHVLALGMVLVREPTLLLLDEPSAGLAPGLGAALLGQVFALANQFGMTLLVIEHRVDVLRMASRALLLGSGGLRRETSTPSFWLTDGTLESAYFNGPGIPPQTPTQGVEHAA